MGCTYERTSASAGADGRTFEGGDGVEQAHASAIGNRPALKALISELEEEAPVNLLLFQGVDSFRVELFARSPVGHLVLCPRLHLRERWHAPIACNDDRRGMVIDEK